MLKKLQRLQKLVVCLILVTIFTFSSFNPAFALSNSSSSETTIERLEASTYQPGTVPEAKSFCELTNDDSSVERVESVLSKYKPNSVFSGVYNIPTGKWMALPSGDASFSEISGDISCVIVPRNGGHSAVQDKLIERFKSLKKDIEKDINLKDNLGFTIELQEKVRETPQVAIGWISGGINCCYYERLGGEKINREVPDWFKNIIKEAIQKRTSYEVTDLTYEKNKEPYKSCPRKPQC